MDTSPTKSTESNSSNAERLSPSPRDDRPAQVAVVCLDRLEGRTRCTKFCALYFPDTPRLRSSLREVLKLIYEECPMRGYLKRKPQFGDFYRKL